jgi:uncharacterized repeat protein (TIGR03803 family)
VGNVGRLALIVGAAALLAGCGGLQAPLGAQYTNPHSRALAARAQNEAAPATSHGYRALYRFKGQSDGYYPVGLTNVNGTLYGATIQGGAGCAPQGCGTIYTITKSGKKTVLYSFRGGEDGSGPGELLAADGALYGTTYQGGNQFCNNGCGTVFRITTSGKENILYQFTGRSDGWAPDGNLTLFKGDLYGETALGGNNTYACRGTCGTIFKVSLSGKLQTVYSFTGGSDGEEPIGGLTLVKSVLYGTTYFGGTVCSTIPGCGTAFKVNATGNESVLYRFKGYTSRGHSADGSNPLNGVLASNGTLFGNTTSGGNETSMGTIFSLSSSGKENVIYRFSGSDGGSPAGKLLAANGLLYGTTIGGGPRKCGPVECGVVFSVSKSGVEQVLYTFKGPRHDDGAEPQDGLIELDGRFYGTTFLGGISDCNPSGAGCGTLFEISP